MLTPEQARNKASKKLSNGSTLSDKVTDYKGYYIFGVINPKMIGVYPIGVNKLTGTLKNVNYMDEGFCKAYRDQHPEEFSD